MIGKPRPSHRTYVQILRRMTPEQRLRKAFDLSEFAKALFLRDLRTRFPELSDDEFDRLARKRLDNCHNRDY